MLLRILVHRNHCEGIKNRTEDGGKGRYEENRKKKKVRGMHGEKEMEGDDGGMCTREEKCMAGRRERRRNGGSKGMVIKEDVEYINGEMDENMINAMTEITKKMTQEIQNQGKKEKKNMETQTTNSKKKKKHRHAKKKKFTSPSHSLSHSLSLSSPFSSKTPFV